MPKAGLSHDLVIQTAAQVSDEVGWEKLHLALVADRLSVTLPALYKHIGSLEGLRHDVALLALAELEEALRTAVAQTSGREALYALAHAFRSYERSHPGRYAATVRVPAPNDGEHAAATRAVQRVLYATLEGYGLAGRDAADGVRAVRAVLHGFVALESAGGFGTAQDVDRTFRRLLEALESALGHWAQSSRHGHLLGQELPGPVPEV